jgi:putative transcriptional regulator
MDKDKRILLKKLGDNICRIRKEKGLTQAELASNANKDQQSIQRLEKGNINPSYCYLIEISKGLEIDIRDLLNFPKEKKKAK